MNQQTLFDRAVKLKDEGDFPGARQIVEQQAATGAGVLAIG